MSTAAEVMAEAARRGVSLAVEGDRLLWRAPAGAMTPNLIEGMKANKAAILDALRKPDIIAEQRWGRPPDVEIAPVTPFTPALHQRDVNLLTVQMRMQPPEVWNWVERQAERYATAARHWPRPVCEVAAMLDALLWQWADLLPAHEGRFDLVTAAARKLRNIEAGVRWAREGWAADAAADSEKGHPA